MIIAIIILLAILWFLGFLPNNFFGIDLFTINGQTITVYDLLILGVILWAVGILPSPFRQIAIVLVVLWALSIIGIIALANFSSLVILAFIVGLVIYFVQSLSHRTID